ncbi:hypothetical protein G3N56_05625 [Desulfovibrio sulfodismutans]|uniref:DNA polymerase III subunit beta n=1 Tax=Desulfolutivibrio sulfodismutans TaxID=63561 RepID=A0A7K3NJ45_9BACT|nr:hypothetical protein [Desulfolutivibrio sulfodismutans]NDY56226.1 hypothetical protein [Desulfolutivibrio sulfodismutans]QLA11286.1 hypothetical protein GD606_02825 [Desulfolutivibrio sulfodismutans DSM 3696]
MATVDRTELFQAVELAAMTARSMLGHVANRALSAVWLVPDGEALAVEASDGSVEFRGRVPAQPGDFEVCGMDAATLHALLKKLPAAEILLTQGPGDSLTLRCGPRRYRLATVDTAWRQPVAAPEGGADAGPDAAAAVTLARYAVATDEALGVQACLHLAPAAGPGECLAEGLDGHQFVRAVFDARALAEVLPEAGVLVAGRHLKILASALGRDGARVCVEGKRLWVAWRGGRLGLALADGPFPDTGTFLARCADPAFSAQIDRQDMLAALAVVLAEHDRTVRLEFATGQEFSPAGRVTLATLDGGGEEDLGAEVTARGELWPVGIAAKDMAGILGLFEAERIGLAFSGPDAPILVTPVDEDGEDGEAGPVRLTAITMPMQFAQESYDEGEA